MNRSVNQKLLIPYIGEPLGSDNQQPGEKIKLNGVSANIDRINWPDYPYMPLVQVYTGYSDAFLWICFEVKKDFFRIKALLDQEAVWEDSCAEFFIADQAGSYRNSLSEAEMKYRNFEFNALGVCLSAYGTISHREMLPKEEMERILRFPGLAKQNLPEEGTEFDWELSVAIPLDLIGLGPGSSFKANFQKCGDLTRRPHYLTWSRIESASPDFHLPQFFGDMQLVS
ncbi:MAG TPA: carbohydrate-binding family 9-like protein [Prolixibacteraceae bacterium]|nr:carbohydrate-binding family 9-like protein [Prolixibacteraceae bacterium]